MNNQLKLLFYIAMLAAIFYFVQNKFNIFDIKLSENSNQEEVNGKQDLPDPYVEIYNMDQNIIRVNVEVADEDYEKSLGLSGRKDLGEYNGMLFVFGADGGYSFWMKDMNIPLDMVFIDSKYFIVDIREGLEPCSNNFCPSIVSNSPFKYVLEVNAGFVETNRIKEGNSVVLNLRSI